MLQLQHVLRKIISTREIATQCAQRSRVRSRRTSEAEIACVCKETPEGIRVSLRSVSDLDVGEVAARFGGGGHQYAAGFVAPYPVTGVLDGIKAALREQRERQSDRLA